MSRWAYTVDCFAHQNSAELLAAGEDGSYFVRQMLPPELEKLAKGNKEGLILVVKFRGMDTHHVLGRDKDNNVTVNNTTYGACPTIDDVRVFVFSLISSNRADFGAVGYSQA